MTRTTSLHCPASAARVEPYSPLNLTTRAVLDQEWTRLRPGLLHYATRFAHPRDAEDLVQATYLKAVTLLDSYDSRTAGPGMYRWLCSILTNVCLKHRHRIDRRNELLLAPSALAGVIDAYLDTTSTDNGDDTLTLQEIETHFQIQSLTHRRREIWALWRTGHTQPEIAAALGLTQQGVSYHIGLIIDQLRATAGDLITRGDGYPSTAAMFNAHARVTIYRRPQRRGAFTQNEQRERIKK